MKRITASEARRNWFRLLDEVAHGAVVLIERKGHRIVLRREDAPAGAGAVPDYRELIRAPDVERADRWIWRWSETGEVEPEEDDVA